MRTRYAALVTTVLVIGAVALMLRAQSPQPSPTARVQFPKDDPDEAMFLILFGEKAGHPSDWSGELSVAGGELEALRGYKFDSQDKILPPNRWSIARRQELSGAVNNPNFIPGSRGEPTVGVMITLIAGPGCEVRVTSTRGNFAFQSSEIAIGDHRPALDGDARIVRVPVARNVGSAWWEDDYPSIAGDRKGGLWVVWAGYHNDRDELGLRYYSDGVWSNYLPAPGNYGDAWWPQVVIDPNDDPWVVWAQPDKDNWDIYTAGYQRASNTWSDVERISDHAMTDINHQARMDAAGNLFVVWQGFRGKSFDILLRVRRGGAWSETYAITRNQGNGWEPAIALDSTGRAWVAWDTYRNGDYDVYLRSFKDGKLGEEIAVAKTPHYEARSSVVVDRQDRVWVAWEQGDTNWGKDTGFTNPAKYKGSPLGRRRQLRVAVYADGKLQAPAQQPEAADTAGSGSLQPRLFVDAEGNVGALFVRRFHRFGPNSLPFWEQQLTFYRGSKWTAPIPLPLSWNRSFTRGQVAASGNQLWCVYATDNRNYTYPTWPSRHEIYVARMTSPPAAAPVLGLTSVETASEGGVHPDEPGDLKAIRAYRTTIGGREARILRGDTHRHTELSMDSNGLGDGSVLEFYRYAIDAAALDWGNVSDHQGGGAYYDYYWWLTNKLADMHHVPGSYVSLFGYERSMGYPDGHRNIISVSRSLRVLPFLRRIVFGRAPEPPQPAEIPGGTRTQVLNDVKYLFKHLRRTSSISIPHTSGTGQGTDWRDNDPEVEPVVEIFQGARVSYEEIGAPLTARSPKESPSGYQPDGFVNNAWAKGYRLGVIASSDHGSTHMSYAMVYAQDGSRQGIIDAIKRRHTFGATDNIILDFKMGDQFMGDEFDTDRALPVRIYVRGTKRIAAVRLIKDQKIIHSAAPNTQEATINYLDNSTTPGKHYYYVRVEQEDGHVAWSSPIWVGYKGGQQAKP